MQNETFREKSWWLETAPYEPAPRLAGDAHVDIAIIGGGFTGLSAAYHLKQAHPLKRVVLVESQTIGYGASGRNGGFAMTLIGKNIATLREQAGTKRARIAHGWARDAVDTVKGLVEAHEIDCDFEFNGMLTVALNDGQVGRLRGEVLDFNRLGTPASYLEGAALAEHLTSPKVKGALLDPQCAILNPAKLAMGLKRVVQELGVEVYEQTKVHEITDGEELIVSTDGGALMVEKKVVLATNAWTQNLGHFKGRVIPIFTYIVMTEPLSEAQLASTGWQHREGIETANHLVHYLRLTADNRIVIGGQDAYYFYGDETDADRCEPQFDVLKRDLVRLFPGLAGVKFERAWGGPVACTFDMLPTMGRLGESGRIIYSLAYNGHGVAPSIGAGKVIRDLYNGEDHRYQDFFLLDRKPLHMTWGPLKWAGAQAYLLGLRAMDIPARLSLAKDDSLKVTPAVMPVEAKP